MERNETDSKTTPHVTGTIKGILMLHGSLKGVITPKKQVTGKLNSVSYPSQMDLATDKDIDDLFL